MRTQRTTHRISGLFSVLVAGAMALAFTIGSICVAPATRVAAATQVMSGPYVTNVTDTSFVVTWVTSTPSTGYIRYGTESANYPSRAEDDRGSGYVGYTHFVRVTGLLGANTRYYYSVVSGDSTLDSPSTYYLITGPSASNSNAFGVSGYVQKTDGAEAEGAIVYAFPQHQENSGIPSSMVWLATLTESDGRFTTNLGQARAATSTARTVGGAFGAVTTTDRVRYRVVGGIRVGGDLNQIDWQSRDITQTDLDSQGITFDPFALPYAEQPTPTISPTPSATSARTATPLAATATPVPTQPPTSTPRPTFAPAPFIAPAPPAAIVAAPQATATNRPSAPTAQEAPPKAGSPTPTPPPPQPIVAAIGTPRPRSTAVRIATATPRDAAPDRTVTPTATAIASTTGGPYPPVVDGLLWVGGVALLGGIGLGSTGVVKALRRRSM